jgi:hypothetical protein
MDADSPRVSARTSAIPHQHDTRCRLRVGWPHVRPRLVGVRGNRRGYREHPGQNQSKNAHFRVSGEARGSRSRSITVQRRRFVPVHAAQSRHPRITAIAPRASGYSALRDPRSGRAAGYPRELERASPARHRRRVVFIQIAACQHGPSAEPLDRPDGPWRQPGSDHERHRRCAPDRRRRSAIMVLELGQIDDRAKGAKAPGEQATTK